MEHKKQVHKALSSEIMRHIIDKTLICHDYLSDDDEEEEALNSLCAYECETRLHGGGGCPRIIPLRLESYAEKVVPTYSISTFRSHFRVSPAAADAIENILSPILCRQGPVGRLKVTPRKQMLSVIWLLATPDSFRSTAEKFGTSKSTLHLCFRRVIHALCSIAKQQIYWPEGSEAIDAQQNFQRLSRMPNMIGAIDGCQIEIDAPKEEPAAYRSGKKKYAIQLQAVCLPNLILTDIFAGYPGSVHDIRVLKNSPLFRDARQIFTGDEYIIGDKAYPVYTWCIPPYKNYGNITEAELAFNNALSKARQVIERCFCLLKGRFRRLKHLCMYRTDEIPVVIMASCVLHNICLRGLYDEPEDIEEFIRDGHDNHTNDLQSFVNAANESNIEGINKRNALRDIIGSGV